MTTDPTQTNADAATPDEIKLMAQRLCADHVAPFHEKEFLSELDKLMDAAAVSLRAELKAYQHRAIDEATLRQNKIDELRQQLSEANTALDYARKHMALPSEVQEMRAEVDASNERARQAEAKTDYYAGLANEHAAALEQARAERDNWRTAKAESAAQPEQAEFRDCTNDLIVSRIRQMLDLEGDVDIVSVLKKRLGVDEH